MRRLPQPVVWGLRAIRWIVPASERDRWLRQWYGEFGYCLRADRSALRCGGLAVASVRHALVLRRQQRVFSAFVADAAYTVRALRRRAGFAALTATTLALGIAAATVVFSVAETALLRRLPLPEEHRLVQVFSTNPSRGMERFSVSYPDFEDFSARNDLFEAATFFIDSNRDLAGGGEPERMRVSAVAPSFFSTLGSRGVLGRTFLEDDHAQNGMPTAVLSEGVWARRFGADSAAIGLTVRLDGVQHTVIGVVPGGQGWPQATQVWVPLRWGGSAPEWADARSNHTWQVIGRLTADVAVADVGAQLAEMSEATYAGDVDERDRGTLATVVPLRRAAAADDTERLLTVMGAAVLLVVMLSTLNASGLLLAHAWGRAKELSVRTALGAARGRIIRLMLTEGVVLAGLGCIIGVGIALLALRTSESWGTGLDQWATPRINGTVLGVALATGLVGAIAAALVPAVRVSGAAADRVLKSAGRQSSEGHGSVRLRSGLVVIQLALSLALLLAAGMTVRGFQGQVLAHPGFDSDNLLTFTTRLPESRYTESVAVDDFYTQAADRLRQHPGVVAAAVTSKLPLGGPGLGLYRAFIFEGEARPPEGSTTDASWVEVSPDFFATLGVRLAAGRTFVPDDGAPGEAVAIVNSTMARQLSGHAPVLGRSIVSVYDENLPRRIVGIVEDVQFEGLRTRPRPTVFVPRAQSPRRAMAFILRTRDEPYLAVPFVRDQLASIDADLALDGLQTLQDAHRADLSGIRFLTVLFSVFGAVALLLSVAGVFGLTAYSVGRRTREFGIRMTLGAPASQLASTVLREGAILATLGVALGLGLAYAFGRILASALFGVTPLEPAVFATVTFVLVVSAMLASWIPARRATRLDPIDTLRAE